MTATYPARIIPNLPDPLYIHRPQVGVVRPGRPARLATLKAIAYSNASQPHLEVIMRRFARIMARLAS